MIQYWGHLGDDGNEDEGIPQVRLLRSQKI
jgi:hypothetical protein